MQWEHYWSLNYNNTLMRTPYTRAILFLTYIKGPLMTRSSGLRSLIQFSKRPSISSLRGANGSRECAPDDRLRDEAIHRSVGVAPWIDSLRSQ